VDYVAQAVLELFSGRPPAEALDDGHISTARAPYGDSAGVVEFEQGRAVAQFARNLAAVYTQGLSCIDLRDARANRERLQKAFSEIDITYSS
jgi:hypothetical protein